MDWLDLATAATTIRVANHEPNAFVMYPTIYGALMNAQTGDGTNASRGRLGPPPSISGKAFLNTTSCTSSLVVGGDFTKFAFGLRSGLQLEVSSTADNMFLKHGIGVKATIRCDYVILDYTAFERLAGVTAS